MNACKLNICPIDAFTGAHDHHAGFAAWSLIFGLRPVGYPKWYGDREDCAYAGRAQIGEEVLIFTRCVPGGQPLMPDRAGVLRIYAASGRARPRDSLLPIEVTDPQAVGLFRGLFVADNSDFVGRYLAFITFTTAGIPRAEVQTFELVWGGHQLGSLIALRSIPRPSEDVLIAQTESGRILEGRGFYLDEGAR
jgi:hypothetical protein